MIFNLQGLTLKAQDIRDKFNEVKLYSYYLDQHIHDLNKLYTCPFHEDSSPSLGFYHSSTGKQLLYKCFGCGSTGNIFELLKQKYNLSYGESINKIRKDFLFRPTDKYNKQSNSLLQETNSFGRIQEDITRKRTEVYPRFRTWSSIDYEYWNQFYIPLSLLTEYDVNPCTSVYIRDKQSNYYQYASHSDNNPIYHYNIDGSDKIYRPLNSSKKGKWLSNCTSWEVQGLKQLPRSGKRLFITSSLKDVLVNRLIGEYAIAPNGEGILIPDKIMDYLFATWEEIILLYDGDEAGIKYANQHSKYYGIKYIYIPYEQKDPSDFTRDYGLDSYKQLLNELYMEIRR